MSFQRKLTNLTNVASGATATLRIPVGPTYDRLMLRIIGNAGANPSLANIQNVRLLANAKVIREYDSLQRLDFINQFHGLPAAANGGVAGAANGVDTSVIMYFRRPGIKQFTPKANGPSLYMVDAQRATALRTANLNTLTLEFTIAGAFATPGGNIECYSDEVPDDSAPISLVEKVRKFTYTPTATGAFETLFDIPRGPRIMAVHYVTGQAQNIQQMTLKANSVALFDNVTASSGPLGASTTLTNPGALQDFSTGEVIAPEVPKNGANGANTMTSLSFIQNGDLDEALRTANLRDLRNTITVGGAAAQLVAFVEYLDTFDGL